MFATLMVCLSWLAFVLAMNGVRWQLSEPAGQALMVLAIFAILRPTILLFGLDTPFPNAVFVYRDVGHMIGVTQFWVITWVAAFALVHALFRSTQAGTARHLIAPDDQRMARFAAAMAVLAIATTAIFVVQYGGIQGLTTASKSRLLEGTTRLFRVPAVLSAYLGASLATIRKANSRKTPWSRRGWVIYVIGAACSYAWGARDAAIFPLLFPVIRMMSRPRVLSWSSVSSAFSRLPRLTLLATVVILGSVSLRQLRDVTLTGKVQSSISGQSTVRKIAVASNHTQYDALMLVIADTPVYLQRGGTALVGAATVSAIPSQLVRSQTVFSPPAVTVAQHYDPSRKSGWPLTPIGDWYFALGPFGVLIGAAISGLLIAKLGNWRQRQRSGSDVSASAVVLLTSTTVLLGGVLMTSPARAVSTLSPIVLLAIGFRLFKPIAARHSPSPHQSFV